MDTGPRESISGFVHSNMEGSMQTGWLFAATETGVKRSMDCFCGWRSAGLLKGAVIAVAYDPSEPKRVYAVAGNRFFASDDGGEHWIGTDIHDAVTALAVDPRGVVYAAGRGALLRSDDPRRRFVAAGLRELLTDERPEGERR